MPWACLDDGFYDDPRLIDEGLATSGLYARCLSYCARFLTDGYVPRRRMGRFLDDGDTQPLETLMRVGLVTEADDDRYCLPEFLDEHGGNRSRAQVESARKKKQAAALKRWGRDEANGE